MLVVDDIWEITEFLSVHLASQGYEVARAYDGSRAIETALFFRPHIILLNFLMPILNGDKAIGYLRAHPSTKNSKIIMTSGFADLKDSFLLRGADAFLAKPFNLQTLDETVTRMLA